MAQPDDTPIPALPDAPTSPARSLPEAGRFGRFLERTSVIFAIGIVLAMAILVFEVISRYFFGAPTIWAHETSTFLSAVTFIFGGLLCVVRNSHIRVVLLYDLVRGKALQMLNALISLACAISTGFFAWAAWRTVKKAVFRPSGDFFLETSGSAWNSPAPALIKIFLFLVLIAMSLQFLILAINYLRAARSHKRALR
ncbi:TRAP transporter small permease subunit [Arenibacterium halophilum]|uniref:TRAP transporter small permease protein n=1 Tax=Arenibacterium halophilum TaxID=2583821 RepID=A0ABY2WX39_9RHOB|nr:TRAP transporter small permease subunit [Arenibacterium halophilum]TMV07371.1 TRAP transporter small permease [Arenibacterium halophilum]